MRIELRAQPFDPWSELRAQEQARPLSGCGATDCFIGWMRDHNQGDTVSGMTLEHYPGMTERELERIAREAQAKWALLDVMILHRVGEIEIGEAIVVVSVRAAHRREAFTACRELMEQLKSSVPLWKKERLASGERWVEQNTPGE